MLSCNLLPSFHMRIRKRRIVASGTAAASVLDADGAAVAASANSHAVLVPCRTSSTLALCKLLVGLSEGTSQSLPTSAGSGERLQLDTTDYGSDPPISQRFIGCLADESQRSETASGDISTTNVSGLFLGSRSISRGVSPPSLTTHDQGEHNPKPVTGSNVSNPKLLNSGGANLLSADSRSVHLSQALSKHNTRVPYRDSERSGKNMLYHDSGGGNWLSADSKSMHVSQGLNKHNTRVPYHDPQQGGKNMLYDDFISVQSELGYGGEAAAREGESTGDVLQKMETIRRRRRSIRRNAFMAVPVSSFKGVARRSRFVISRQTAHSGVSRGKKSLCWALQLVVSEADSEGATVEDIVRRLIEEGYSKLFKADGVPRSVQVKRALRANPRVLELRNGRFVLLENRGKEGQKEESWDEGEVSKRERKLMKYQAVKDVLNRRQWQCNRKDGRGWQCSRNVKEGYTYCEHHLVKIKANHARSALKIARMKREGLWNACSHGKRVGAGSKAAEVYEEGSGVVKNKVRKRRYFKSLQEIENEGLKREEGGMRVRGPIKCLLNSNPTEWRADLF